MGLIVLLFLAQLALCFAVGWQRAGKGFWRAVAPVPVLPLIAMLLAIALAFGDGLDTESWARTLPFVAIGAAIMLLAGLVAAVVAYMWRK